jgi:uncharacterized protein (TIGR03089 family)
VFLTYCDDNTGERVEMSATDLGRWAARTACMLRDGYGLQPGSRAAVLAPPHWQTAAILLGAWSVGITVAFRSWTTAGLVSADPDEPYDALFVTQSRLDSWLETMPQAWHRFVLNPSAAPEIPDGYHDYLAEASQYPDASPAYQMIPESGPASPDGTTYREWAGLARELAATMNLRAGDTLLVDGQGVDEPVRWLLAPLVAGASILVIANRRPGSLEDRRADEGATHAL